MIMGHLPPLRCHRKKGFSFQIYFNAAQQTWTSNLYKLNKLAGGNSIFSFNFSYFKGIAMCGLMNYDNKNYCTYSFRMTPIIPFVFG